MQNIMHLSKQDMGRVVSAQRQLRLYPLCLDALLRLAERGRVVTERALAVEMGFSCSNHSGIGQVWRTHKVLSVVVLRYNRVMSKKHKTHLRNKLKSRQIPPAV